MADEALRRILESTHTIAMLGASDDLARASLGVMRYLQQNGYRVIPVNPRMAGRTLLGETVYASLDDIPDNFELVDVFRRVAAIPGIVAEILPLIQQHAIKTLWLQLGIADEVSAQKARSAGLSVVMDKCIKIEHARYAATMSSST